MEFNYKTIIKEKNIQIKNILNKCEEKDKEIERLNNIIHKALYWLSENTHYTSLKTDKLIQDDNTNLLELLEILDKGGSDEE